MRAIDVEIDRMSWRTQPIGFRHPFPSVLARQAGPVPVNLLLMLIRLGELATPALTPQSGVARLWPLLRYLHIMADTPGLRLRSAWGDVDPHQKAVASDDLGVALGMTVLDRAFDYVACIDGREYLHRLAQLGLVKGQGGNPPKVGTMKMADFAALDRHGKVHLIECKGTQHSEAALNRAIADGQYQKRSMVCSSRGAEQRLIGQRLVVGTRLALETGQKPTKVIVVDPAPLEDEPVILQARIPQPKMAEAAMRLEVSRALGAAGAERTAVVIAQADRSSDAPALEGPEQRTRTQAAFSHDEASLQGFTAQDDFWLGERVIAPLLEPLVLDGTIYRYARLVKGVSKRLLAELREAAEASVLFQQQYRDTAELMQQTRVVANGVRAAIIRPGVSLTEVTLLSHRKED